MPTYIKDLTYLTHTVLRVKHQLKVVEEPVIPSNQSKLTVSIVRTNSGSTADGGTEYLTLKINGQTVYDQGRSAIPDVPAYGSDEVFTQTHYVPHNSSGGGSFKVSVSYKCDLFEEGGVFTFLLYGTTATASLSGNLTPIDLSAPTITALNVSANRYGKEASAVIIAEHSSYPLTNIQFTLSGLTFEQAYHRRSVIYGSEYKQQSDGTYKLTVTFTDDLTSHVEKLINLDTTYDIAPLDSGGKFGYTLTVTAPNSQTTTVSGTLAVPQKVTGISCENSIDLKQDTAEKLEYTVEPYNAELTAVEFQSSDASVASVDENGLITALSSGMATITVTTVDGGFSDSCIVSVFNTDVFPQLSELTVLTVKDISKLSFACNFLRGKLIESGTEVPVFVSVACEGRSHPVAEIRTLLEAIETNCQTLKASAESAGASTDSLPEPQSIEKQNINWYTVINEWIVFLNELNQKLN